MKRYCGSEQSGRSMVEMLGVLAIIGVLSVGGIAGYSKAMAKYKVNQALEQASTLMVNIRSVFANQTSFTDATTANVIALGIPTGDMLNAAGNAMINPFNGAITVNPGAAGNGYQANETFTITYAGLDTNACQTIALADWGSAASSGLISITINNTAFTWAAAAGGNSLPLTVGDAATNCNNAGNGNSITWQYR